MTNGGPRHGEIHGRRRARARRLVALGAGALCTAALALALGGCGIPMQATARPVSVPAKDKILSPATTTTGPQTVAGFVQVDVYFTRGRAYVLPEPRFLKPPAHLATVIDLLLDGPKTSERYTGIETALAPSVRLKSVQSAHNIVSLNFTGAFFTLSGTQEILGVAQVVETVDADKPGVGVLFDVDGVPITVPLQTGRLDSEPVRSSEYAALIAPTSTNTTTTTTGASATGTS